MHPHTHAHSSTSQGLALCLCFKDSSRYLDEWLRFYHAQGVSRFFLYDNESSDDFLSVLKPWIDVGLVDLESFPGRGVQEQIYNHCLNKAADKCRWLAFLDDDEFLFSTTGTLDLAEALEPYSDFAGVAIPWVLYGSSGLEQASEAWVTSRFLRSAGGPDQQLKCVVQPSRVIRSLTIGHHFEAKPGFEIVDENRSPVHGPLHKAPSISKFRINHYIIKSWEEWKLRRSRPQADSGVITPHPEALWREWDEAWSRIHDPSLLHLESAMKQGGPLGSVFAG